MIFFANIFFFMAALYLMFIFGLTENIRGGWDILGILNVFCFFKLLFRDFGFGAIYSIFEILFWNCYFVIRIFLFWRIIGLFI